MGENWFYCVKGAQTVRHWEACNVFIQLFLRIKVLKLHAHITIFSLPSLSHMEREGTKNGEKKMKKRRKQCAFSFHAATPQSQMMKKKYGIKRHSQRS